jgi:hypothetical protein
MLRGWVYGLTSASLLLAFETGKGIWWISFGGFFLGSLLTRLGLRDEKTTEPEDSRTD